jgi:hypothetical protein
MVRAVLCSHPTNRRSNDRLTSSERRPSATLTCNSSGLPRRALATLTGVCATRRIRRGLRRSLLGMRHAGVGIHRAPVLHHRGTHAGTVVGARRGPHATATRRCTGRRASRLSVASTPPCPRGRDGPGGRAGERDPAPARAHRPWRHVGLLQGIDNPEIIDTIQARRPPLMPARVGLRL